MWPAPCQTDLWKSLLLELQSNLTSSCLQVESHLIQLLKINNVWHIALTWHFPNYFKLQAKQKILLEKIEFFLLRLTGLYKSVHIVCLMNTLTNTLLSIIFIVYYNEHLSLLYIIFKWRLMLCIVELSKCKTCLRLILFLSVFFCCNFITIFCCLLHLRALSNSTMFSSWKKKTYKEA